MAERVIPERLAALDTITLHKSSHLTFAEGHCAMEVVAWLAGEDHTDVPDCASPVLRTFMIELNDQWGDEQRQKLRPYLPGMVGTAGDGQDEARAYLALDWLIRVFTPAWLELAGLSVEAQALRDLRRIADLVSAQAAGLVVRDARTKADAAEAAAWVAGGSAGGSAGGVAAEDAGGSAAWDAALVAARAAAMTSARDAAWDAALVAARAAAMTSARDAAWDALKPTIEALQQSALELLGRMINPAITQPS
jgi:hypothetical protein